MGEILPAAHGVGEVDLPTVPLVDVGQGRGDATLGHYGMRLAEERLRDHAHLGAGGRSLDGGAQAGAPRSDDQNVELEARELGHLEKSPVVPDPHGDEADVEV